MRRHESPVRRVNPSGKERWVARYTNADGERRSAGTFKLRREAQAAIDAAYDRPVAVDTVGAYFAGWTRRHPRSDRTNATNEHRIGRVLDVKVEGRKLRHWPLAELKRRHAHDLVDHMLRVQGRAATGAVGILRSLSAMAEDAVTDELLGANPFRGVRVRANDPRATKAPRKPPVYSWEQMHRFAGDEAMIRVLSDCGLRLGEMLGLERRDFDGEALNLRGAAHNGVFTEGDQATKRHVRRVPVPPVLAGLLVALPPRIDTPLLFPTPKGKLWRERNFYRDVWHPVRELHSDMGAATPHSFRHSWESHLHAAGIDPADLARVAGHTVATMHGRYVHALGRSDDRIRGAVG
jgi:integrase